MDPSNPLHEHLVRIFPDDRHVALKRLDLKDGLTSAEFIGMVAADGVRRTYRSAFGGREIDCHFIGSAEPVSKVISSKGNDFSVAILSTGCVNTLAAICGRLAHLVQREKPLDYPFQLQRLRPEKKLPLSLGEFSLDSAAHQHTCLTREAAQDTLDELSPFGAQCAIELLSAAIEFLFLHEAAHVAMCHADVIKHYRIVRALTEHIESTGRIVEGKSGVGESEARLNRLLEHHADCFAYWNMFFDAPARPLTWHLKLSWPVRAFSDRYSRRMIGILGAAVAISYSCLVSGDWTSGRLVPNKSARGGHPPPMIRLAAANSFLLGALANPLTRLFLWPSTLFKRYDVPLQVAEMRAICAAFGVVHSDWDSLDVLHAPAKDWQPWMQEFFHSRAEQWKRIATESFAEEMRNIDETSRRMRKLLRRGSLIGRLMST